MSSILKSIAAHGVLLVLFLAFVWRGSDSPDAAIPFEIRSLPAKQARKAPTPPRSPQVKLADIGMRMDFAARSETLTTESSSAISEENTDEGGWDTINPNPQMARFNRYVYQTVQGWLDRDSYLNQLQISGIVRVRIWFDGDGNYLGDRTEYQAEDEGFKSIVARALNNAFLNPIPRAFLYRRDTFSIVRQVVIRQF